MWQWVGEWEQSEGFNIQAYILVVTGVCVGFFLGMYVFNIDFLWFLCILKSFLEASAQIWDRRHRCHDK